MNGHEVIVIGASAGGVSALKTLTERLPADLPASVLIVQHMSPESPALLSRILSQRGKVQALTAKEGMALEHGKVYVAPPDRHLLVEKNRLLVRQGPKENRSRPAIDPLFRSAAVAFNLRVVSVVLTGCLNDGAAGTVAVHRCGGITMAQDPNEADFPQMPEAALETGAVDHCLSLEEMPDLLQSLVAQPNTSTETSVPKDLLVEAKIAQQVMSDMPAEDYLGNNVPFGCPECGGPLWQLDDPVLPRYRCHIGHGYTAQSLLADQDHALEKAMLIALRTLEERANLLRSMAMQDESQGRQALAQRYKEELEQNRAHIQAIRSAMERDPFPG